ncbi:MAG: ribbon-helix-helix protein, CopG family [Paracoccaceae bacterium]
MTQRENRTARLTLAVQPGILEQLQVLAETEERSLTQIIERLIRAAYERKVMS